MALVNARLPHQLARTSGTPTFAATQTLSSETRAVAQGHDPSTADSLPSESCCLLSETGGRLGMPE